jgi:hypothetical protein
MDVPVKLIGLGIEGEFMGMGLVFFFILLIMFFFIRVFALICLASVGGPPEIAAKIYFLNID